MAYPVVLRQLIASSLHSKLVVPFRPAMATDLFDRFSTTSRRLYHSDSDDNEPVSLEPEERCPYSSKREDADNIYLTVTMPGLEKKNVNATVNLNKSPTLSITAERMIGYERKRYKIETDVLDYIKVTGITQKMKNGVLTVTLPKLKKEKMLNAGDIKIKIN